MAVFCSVEGWRGCRCGWLGRHSVWLGFPVCALAPSLCRLVSFLGFWSICCLPAPEELWTPPPGCPCCLSGTGMGYLASAGSRWGLGLWWRHVPSSCMFLARHTGVRHSLVQSQYSFVFSDEFLFLFNFDFLVFLDHCCCLLLCPFICLTLLKYLVSRFHFALFEER